MRAVDLCPWSYVDYPVRPNFGKSWKSLSTSQTDKRYIASQRDLHSRWVGRFSNEGVKMPFRTYRKRIAIVFGESQ
jgi:hypothetical protein